MTPKHARQQDRRYVFSPACLRLFFHRPCAGQALVETLIVVILLVGCLLFFFDFAVNASSRILLHNAAARVARADTVGFNDFHCAKSLRVSMIPVSGAREAPETARGVRNGESELAFIRAYLQAESFGEANGILRYEYWKNLSHDVSRSNDRIRVRAAFAIPEQLPYKFARFFGVVSDRPDGLQSLTAEWAIEDHASYYLDR